MTNSKTLLERIRGLSMQLADEELSAIDLDDVRATLDAAVDALSAVSSADNERDTLREDYTARIAGMLKAIAAVERNRDRRAETAALIEALSGMSGVQLVACYRQTSARFRDCFPTSFGLLQTRPSSATGNDHTPMPTKP
ncbi:hypothetical protein GF420_07830 [candidate division GN15 bacterium]|nr:hypothetical protein [candidate division GN15 bacterium]